MARVLQSVSSSFGTRQIWSTRRACRAGVTPRTFWAAESRKSGVAPARFGVLSTASFLFAAFPFLCRTRTLLRHRVKKAAREKVQSVISTFFTPSRGFVVGRGDPPKDLHSKIHSITTVVALPLRGRMPTLIAQPLTHRCLNCSRKTCPFVACVLHRLQRWSHAHGWALTKSSPHLYRGEKTGKPHQLNSAFGDLDSLGPRL